MPLKRVDVNAEHGAPALFYLAPLANSDKADETVSIYEPF
jgi:hypothetical protein